VYRGLDIGTAKVTADERARVVHHGLDLVEPDAPFSVADFRDHALSVLRDLADRGGIGLLVGGTGLWLRAIALGLDTDALPSDRGVRAALEARLASDGLAPLVEDLTARAPTLAASVDLANPRRVVRALEIATLRGDAPRPVARGYPAPIVWLGLDVTDRAEHARRIAVRARQQFDDGLIDEARALRERFDPSLPAFSAIGYREAWSVLDGERTLDEAIDDDVRRNVQFSKRQRTWFRSEPDVTWLEGGPDATAHALALAARVAGR
jgi:tRNA dimethylallyltransferase